MHFTDWFVLGAVTAIMIAATVFLFMHPSAESFGVWGTAVATICTAYHWITIRDSKEKDLQ